MREAHGAPLVVDRSHILRDQELIQARTLEMQRLQPSESRSQESPSPIRCSTCGRTFARKEHLRRHQKTHTKEKPYQCPTCGKDFSRQDVLNRHLVAHQSRDASFSTPTVSSRACEQCAAGRARCTKQQPCQRCSDRNLDCRYPTKKRRRESRSSQQEPQDEVDSSLPETSASDSGATSQEVSQPLFDPPDLQQPLDESSGSLINAPAESTVLSSWSVNSGLNPTTSTLYDFTQPGLGLSGINWMSPQDYQFGDWDAQLADVLRHREDPSVNASFPFFFQNPGAPSDSQLYDGPMDLSIAPNPQVDLSLGSSQAEAHRTPSSDAGSKLSTSTEGNYYVDGTGARAAFGGRRKQRFSIANVDVLHEEDTSDANSSITTGNLVSQAAYEFMMAGIREITSQQAAQESSLSHARVQGFVQQYFESFHPAFPFIRPATLREKSHDWTLLLAVAATGSRYARRSQGHHCSDFLLDALHKRLRRLMYEPASMDDTTPFAPGQSIRGQSTPRLQTVQARILAVACMLHSGRKTLMDSALVDRQYLVEACGSLGLLSPSVESRTQNSTNRIAKRGEWLPREDHTRTGIMVWLLDTMLSYEFDCKPLMSLADVQCSLPGSEALWESVDAEGTVIRRSNQALTLPEAMDLLYLEKRTPPHLGEFSVSLLVHAIFRKTREVIAWEQTRMTAWTPSTSVRSRNKPVGDDNWLPNTAATSRWRNSACDCLDVLHWSANSRTASRSGSEHHTILLLHLSRLILLAPTKHIQALANTSTTQSQTNSGVGSHATARDQVLQWVVRDQYKARLCIVHCGALYWHVRRYSCDSVIEPFAIYIATLILWAFSVSTQFVGQDAIHSYATCETPTATSHHPEDDTVPSFLHLDRPLDDELVQAFVRIGYKMSGFIMGVGNIQGSGAPGKIVQEGLRLLGRSTQAVEKQTSSGMLPAQDASVFTWGIEGPYMESLRQMAQASTS